MYEGLTADIRDRAIPPGLDIRIVSGSAIDDKGTTTGQLDRMPVGLLVALMIADVGLRLFGFLLHFLQRRNTPKTLDVRAYPASEKKHEHPFRMSSFSLVGSKNAILFPEARRSRKRGKGDGACTFNRHIRKDWFSHAE